MKSKISKPGRGGTRPGAGRPRGARNRITQELKEMLAPLDQMAIERLEGIIRHGSDKQAIEAIRLTWAYRFGPPKVQGEYAEGEGSLVDTGAVLVIGGDERSYIKGLQRARRALDNEDPPPGHVASVAPKSLPPGTPK